MGQNPLLPCFPRCWGGSPGHGRVFLGAEACPTLTHQHPQSLLPRAAPSFHPQPGLIPGFLLPQHLALFSCLRFQCTNPIQGYWTPSGPSRMIRTFAVSEVNGAVNRLPYSSVDVGICVAAHPALGVILCGAALQSPGREGSCLIRG